MMHERTSRLSRYILGITVCFVVGCTPHESIVSDASRSRSPDTSERASTADRQRPKAAERKPMARTIRAARSRSAAQAMTSEDAAQRVFTILEDSLEFAPTLAVWFFDVSPSAMRWGEEVHQAIGQFYGDVALRWPSASRERLDSAVWTIGKEPTILVPRSGDPREVVDAIKSLRADTSGRETTFTAVEQALQQYLDARIRERREVMFVIVSDEAGDDWQQVDQLIAQPRKYALPIFAIGVPAPFGRRAALDASIEAGGRGETDLNATAGTEDWSPIVQGPETREVERIQLAYDGYADDLELMDSGFGPFGLERLCRATGGAFLAVRSGIGRGGSVDPRQLQWPIPGATTFDPEVMRRYVPEPLDARAYQLALESNPARRALHEAAQLPRAAVLRDPQLRFVKRNEADLKNMLDKAQQAAAKAAPAVDQLYEILREHADAAENSTVPRLRACYDLALGRVCAAKARIDGYNSMLAALKRGKSFERETSTTWVLQRADSTPTGSALEKLIARGHELLQRVIEQHPGTPWSVVAQQELTTPLGWQWTEE